MFQTSQPNSNRPGSNQSDHACDPNPHKPVERERELQFATLEELGAWIDAQLLLLEEQHEGFLTCDSVRSFFQRK